MKFEPVIMFIVMIILNSAGIYLYKFVPRYQTDIDKDMLGKEIENIQIKKYFLLSTLVNLIVVLFYSFLYVDNAVINNVTTFCVLSFLWPAAYFDYKFLKIPNEIIRYALVLRCIELLPQALIFKSKLFRLILDELLIVIIIFVLCIIGNLIIKNSIGMGDIKLLMVMGAFFGTSSFLSSIFFTLFVAFILAVILLLTGKKSKKDVLPFAPSILIGTVLAAILMGI